MNVAVLLAGGSGKRMGGPEPKQFIVVAGCTILEHSIRAFNQNPDIDNIIIVSHSDYIDRVKEISHSYPKVSHIVAGGKERYDSTLSALKAIQQSCPDNEDSRVLIHDCVRCLVSQRIITECIEALSTYQAVDVAIPCTDTICEVNDLEQIIRIPARATLRNVQTPQGFLLSTISKAYAIGLQDPNFVTTDDCGVVHHYLPEISIYVVKGESTNIKITYPEDLILAEKILKDQPESFE